MVFINETGTIGLTLAAATQNLTGDFYATMLAIFIFILAMTFIFRLGILEISILVTPMIIVLAAYRGGEWTPIAGLVLIALAIFFARNWIVPSR